MSINTISDHILEDMELRLIGVDHRPWAMSPPASVDDEGRRMIMKGSQRASKKAFHAGVKAGAEALGKHVDEGTYTQEDLAASGFGDGAVHGPTMQKALALFHRTDHATDEMLEFIVHAPEDIEKLIREIRQLRIMATKAKEERDSAVQELQGSKIAASRAEAKIVDMRRAWRLLCKEMGTKP